MTKRKIVGAENCFGPVFERYQVMVVIIGGPKNRAYLAIVIGSQHENRIA